MTDEGKIAAARLNPAADALLLYLCSSVFIRG
jgi:hypothetical protein